MAEAGAAAAAAAGAINMFGDVISGIKNRKDFCLNPADAAANAGENIGISILNLFGGLGDAIVGATGQKTPLQKIQDDVKNDKIKYRQTFDALTQKFDSQVVKTDAAFLKSLSDMKLYNAANINFIEEVLEEKIDMNTLYIIFLTVFSLIIYFYLTMS